MRRGVLTGTTIEVTPYYIESVFASEEFTGRLAEICYGPESRKNERAFVVGNYFSRPEFRLSRTETGFRRPLRKYGHVPHGKSGYVVATGGHSIDQRDITWELIDESDELLYLWSFHSHLKTHLDQGTLLGLKPSGRDLIHDAEMRQNVYLKAAGVNCRPINGIFQRHEGNIYLLIYQEPTENPALQIPEVEQRIVQIDGFWLRMTQPQMALIKSKSPIEQVKYVVDVVKRLTPFQAAALVYERRDGIYTLTEESKLELPRFAHTVEFYPLPKEVQEVSP